MLSSPVAHAYKSRGFVSNLCWIFQALACEAKEVSTVPFNLADISVR